MRCERAKSELIFSRSNERTDHCVLLRNVAQCGAINLAKKKNETADISITSEISEVLCRDKGTIVFEIYQGPIINGIRLQIIVCQSIKHAAASTLIKQSPQRRPLCRHINAYFIPDSRQHSIHKSRAIERRRILSQKLGTLHESICETQLRLREIWSTHNQSAIQEEIDKGNKLVSFNRVGAVRVRKWLIISVCCPVDSVHVRAGLLKFQFIEEGIRYVYSLIVDALQIRGTATSDLGGPEVPASCIGLTT